MNNTRTIKLWINDKCEVDENRKLLARNKSEGGGGEEMNIFV